MSLVKSHHSNLYKNNLKTNKTEMTLIKDIAIDIINKHAPLIVDIESGRVSRSLLEKEIVIYLDQSTQYNMNREKIITDVFNYMFGYSHLQKYIDDESISDIDGSRHNFFMIKRNGIKEIVPINFEDENTFLNFCKLIIIRNGGVINENDCHARVADHKYRLRINVSIEPRNISGTSLTIRKHRMNSYSLQDLVKMNTLNDEMNIMLAKLMKSSARIIVIGKGGSGKTTLLRALLNEVSITDRILVCESDSELFPENPNFIVQRVKKGDKGRNAGLQELVKDGLTMSLDGYCVGELVGKEIWDFLKAGYTDHKIYGTLHALGIEETFLRIITMIGDTTTNMNDSNLISFISNSIDIIIYMKKFKIMNITQLIPIRNSTGMPRVNELFAFIPLYETNSLIEGDFVNRNELDDKLKDELKRKRI